MDAFIVVLLTVSKLIFHFGENVWKLRLRVCLKFCIFDEFINSSKVCILTLKPVPDSEVNSV